MYHREIFSLPESKRIGNDVSAWVHRGWRTTGPMTGKISEGAQPAGEDPAISKPAMTRSALTQAHWHLRNLVSRHVVEKEIDESAER